MAEKVTRAGAAAIELLKKERDELREMLHTAHKHARGDSDFIINEQAKNRELQAEVARLKKEAGEWDIERNNEHS